MATDVYDIAYTFTHNNITLEHNAMNNKNTIAHMDVHNTQYWAHCAPPIDAHWFHIAPCGSSPPRTRHPIHACAPVSCVLVVFSSLALFATSSHRSPSSPSWCPPQRSTRGPGPTPCATSAWGPWSHPTTRHPSQVMSPRRTWTSRTLKSSTSRQPAMSTGSTPWTTILPSSMIPTSTTTSLQNSLQLWSIEQGNLLRWEEIMINFPVTLETWKVLRISFLWSHNPKWSVKLGVCSCKDRWGARKL